MTVSEVAKLFAYCCYFDGRLQVDEGKIRAWHQVLIPDMTFEFAQFQVARHYSENDSVIAPSMINKVWKIRERDLRERARTNELIKELEYKQSQKATPEQIDIYLSEIRSHFRKAETNVELETNSGEVAPNL
jgi:hypothetical protein